MDLSRLAKLYQALSSPAFQSYRKAQENLNRLREISEELKNRLASPDLACVDVMSIKDLSQQHQTLETICEQSERDFETQRRKLISGRKTQRSLDVLNAFYSAVLADLTSESLQSLSSFLTSAYSYLFDAEDTGICLDIIESRGKKTIHLSLKKSFGGEIFIEDLDEDQGGACKTIVCLLLQIYFLSHVDLERIIFIDETFSQLNPDVLSRLLSLLEDFVKRGFVFCIITHSPEQYKNHATKVYTVHKGQYSEESDLPSFFHRIDRTLEAL